MLEHRKGGAGAGHGLHRPGTPKQSGPRLVSYLGPERRSGSDVLGRMMALALDEIDYGVLMIDAHQRVIHCNHAARLQLQAGHPLMMEGEQLWVREEPDVHALQAALEGARKRGLRRLVSLGEAAQRRVVSVVPLSKAGGHDTGSACLLVLGKSPNSGSLAIQGFARTHKLSPGEVQVLAALCEGAVPADIAAMHQVAISTVRTQIASIRAKTRTQSIRELVRQVAMLPPLVGALRQGTERLDDGGRAAGTPGCAAFVEALHRVQS